MTKVFNIDKVDRLIIKIQPYYFLSEVDIFNKNAIKVLKKHIKSNYAINNINTILSKEEFNNLVKKFFPLKFASLNGIEFKTAMLFYSDEDKKVHWIIKSNNSERHFKIKTNEIYSRIEEYIIPWFNKIKKEMDKLYGYWIEETNAGWFITDMNKNKDGSYKIIVTSENLKVVNNSFGNIEKMEDLYIKE